MPTTSSIPFLSRFRFAMNQWAGKVAFVQDIGDGVGASIVKELVNEGVHVVGMAEHVELLENLAMEVKNARGKFHPFVGDASNEKDIVAAFATASKFKGGVDILVNNVDAFAKVDPKGGRMTEADWRTMNNRNMQSFRMSIRCLLNSLKSRKLRYGHVIHVDRLENLKKSLFPNEAMYYASKYGISTIIKGLRSKFYHEKGGIRLTIVYTGTVGEENPEMVNAGCGEVVPETPVDLNPKDVAGTVIFALSAPKHVQITEVRVMSMNEE